MELPELVDQINGFEKYSPRDRICLFGWFLHSQKGRELFDNGAIRECYRAVHLVPDNVAVYLPRLAAGRNPDLLKERGQYKLARAVRSKLDGKYGVHPSVVRVSQLLEELPTKVPDLSEQQFLMEAMRCYRVGANRACVVMTWNLAFHHLRNWVLGHPARVGAFNSTISARFPKRAHLTIQRVDDFGEFTEAEVIEIAYTASLLTKNVVEILREKLKRRNAAAHPSSVVVTQSQADDVITDLVNNVVLALS